MFTSIHYIHVSNQKLTLRDRFKNSSGESLNEGFSSKMNLNYLYLLNLTLFKTQYYYGFLDYISVSVTIS